MVQSSHSIVSLIHLLCSRRIKIQRNEDGYLSARLLSKNETRVVVQFGFKSVNYTNDDHSKCTGKEEGFCIDCKADPMPTGTLHEFSFIDDCCEAKLLPCTEIASPDNGFLRDDHFLVRLDMRLKQDDSECCQISVVGKTATCQVSSMFRYIHCPTLNLEFSGSRDS